MFTPDHIFNFINAPISIKSVEQINDLIKNPSCLTLIEDPFFKKILPIIQQTCTQNIEGDIVIIGVFKGGAALYLKSLFEYFGVNKRWWLFDSFNGFNFSTLKHEKDLKALSLFKTQDEIVNFNSESITKLFQRFNLDQNLNVVEGFIENTLEPINIDSIAFLHIDIDCYEPTLLALNHLYPKLSKNAWVVIDDYHAHVFNCKEAVDYYRRINNIYSPIVELGNYPIGWKK